MKNILFFGDSLTAGYGLKNPLTESFPVLIQKKLDAIEADFKTVNCGVSGDTSGDGLARIEAILSLSADIFVLELGANDFLRGYPASWTKSNLQEIIDRVKAVHPTVDILLLGMSLPEWVPGIGAIEFRAIYHQIADENNIALVPFFLEGVAGVKQLNMEDGLHPLAEGYQIISETIWPALYNMIKKRVN